jgi:hypothetical protein
MNLNFIECGEVDVEEDRRADAIDEADAVDTTDVVDRRVRAAFSRK